MQGPLVLNCGIILLLLYFVTRDDIKTAPEALLAPEHTFDRALRMLQWPRTLANFQEGYSQPGHQAKWQMYRKTSVCALTALVSLGSRKNATDCGVSRDFVNPFMTCEIDSSVGE
jgi:hypothetical protein